MTQYFSGIKTTLCLVPDYSTTLTITNNSFLEENVYVIWHWFSLNDNSGHFYINDTAVDVYGNSTYSLTKGRLHMFSGFIAKGSKVKWDGSSVKFFKVA